jgi:hypothetical protein
LTAAIYRGGNGSTSAPTYSFANDTNSGFYLASPGGYWGIVAAGTELLRANAGYYLSFRGDYPFAFTGGSFTLGSASVDTFISRKAPGVIAIGAASAVGDASGTLNAATLVENTSLTPASATTAGVTGQIAWQGTNGTTGQIFICTSGGVAGSAIWMAAAMSKV